MLNRHFHPSWPALQLAAVLFYGPLGFWGPLCSADDRERDSAPEKDSAPEQGSAPQQDKEQEARRVEGLKNMQRSAAQYTLSSADTPQRAFRFHETPIIRP